MRRPPIAWPLAAMLLMMVPALRGAQQPAPADGVLPDFDIRATEPRGARPPAVAERLGALEQVLGRRVVARPHPLTGSVRTLRAYGGPLNASESGPPVEVARRFIAEQAILFGLDPGSLPDLQLDRTFTTRGGALEHVRFAQQVDGIEVFESALTVHLNGRGEVVWVTNSTVPSRGRPVAPALLAAEQAVRLAALNVRPELAFDPVRVSGPAGANGASSFQAGPFARDIPARLVLFPTVRGLVLAWRLHLEPPGFPQAYDLLVDARRGTVLYRRNTYDYANGVGAVIQSGLAVARDPRLASPYPEGESPSGPADSAGGCPPLSNLAVRDLVTPFRDPLTVLDDTGRLSGNNVHVYRGVSPTEGAIGLRDESGTWRFEFPFNSPDSVETHLFFLANFLHDFFYDLGFDEAAGNFQANNFGRGGVGGDALTLHARASGRNNANFGTPEDGQSPTMNMFLWDGRGCWAEDVDGDGTTDLDGGYDADIVIHEYHHGVTHRLNTAFTGVEAGAIGEGGGDFFAYSLNGDTLLADYSLPPTGIRQINSKTYGDWTCLLGIFCQVHDNGQIWANTLWGIRQRFGADLVNGSATAAVHEVHQLYVDGLKLSPPGPTMLDLRDSMLAADAFRNPSADPGGSANFCRLWEEFARVGMGAAAVDTSQTVGNTVVEDFTVDPLCPAAPDSARVTVSTLDPVAEEAGMVPGAVTVARTGSTSAALTVRYDASGTAMNGVDYQSLSGTVTVPAGEVAATISVVPIDDSAVENDETVVISLAPSFGYVIDQPSTASITIESDDVVADLRVASLTVPAAAAPGASVLISDGIVNAGTGPAAASTTRYYLSTNVVLDASDTELGSRAVPALNPGQTASGTVSVTLPASLETASYWLLASADADQVVDESNEYNNNAFRGIAIGPDLVISAMSAPAQAGPGTPFAVTDTTGNAGASAAPASQTRFYLSADVIYDASDVELGSRSVPSISAGGAHTGSTTLTLPSGTDTGRWYLIAYADGGNGIVETKENNNTRFAQITVGPDLTITTFSVPYKVARGVPFAANEGTRNQGQGSAVASSTGFYLSADYVFDPSDTLIGARAVPALAPGASSNGSTAVTIPTEVPAGRYSLMAVADWPEEIEETSEYNNRRLTTLQVGPDLTAAVATAPFSAAAGATISLSDRTSNLGAEGAPPSSTTIYLSANWTWDAGDVALVTRAVGSVGPNGTNYGTQTTVTLPAGLAPGTYYLIARADDDESVGESTETNNVGFRQLRIE